MPCSQSRWHTVFADTLERKKCFTAREHATFPPSDVRTSGFGVYCSGSGFLKLLSGCKSNSGSCRHSGLRHDMLAPTQKLQHEPVPFFFEPKLQIRECTPDKLTVAGRSVGVRSGSLSGFGTEGAESHLASAGLGFRIPPTS